MESVLTRRRLLGAGGTAAALSAAGCSGSINDDGASGSEPAEPGESDGAHEVTVVADIDRTEIQKARDDAETAQQEAQEALEAGDIDEEEAREIIEEAQAAVEETQRDLITDAVSAIESHIEDVAGLSVSDSNVEFGVALVEGNGDSIVELLALEDVQAIIDGAEYDTI